MACCNTNDQAIKDGKLLHDGTGWQINGCCGQCFVISDLLFCPWCGTKLPERKRRTAGAIKEAHRVKHQLTLKSITYEEG